MSSSLYSDPSFQFLPFAAYTNYGTEVVTGTSPASDWTQLYNEGQSAIPDGFDYYNAVLRRFAAAGNDVGGGGGGADASTFTGMSMDQIAAKNQSMTPEQRTAYWNGENTENAPGVVGSDPVTSAMHKAAIFGLTGLTPDLQNALTGSDGSFNWTAVIVVIVGVILLGMAAYSIVGGDNINISGLTSLAA